MKLTLSRPVQEQIREAIAGNIPLLFDLRAEAMGDKAAFTAIISWLADLYGSITVLECPNGRTPFMLREYYYHKGVEFESIDPLAEFPGLDLCTTGTNLPSNWELHAYLASLGLRPWLDIPGDRHDAIVFAIRTGAAYDQRKDMNLDRARQTIDELTRNGYAVEVLYDRQDPDFPEAKPRSMDECLQLISGCRAFIGGDTGFSHVAAGIPVPQVALYPDYFRFGKASLTKLQAVSDWWGLKGMIWTPFSSLPNNPKMMQVELGSDHKWSLEYVLKALEKLGVKP
jgi:hypothetical protein